MRLRSTIFAASLAGAAVWGWVGPASAQWLNYPDSRTPRTRDGKPNLSARAPRTHDGKPDFSGVWKAEPTPLSEIEQVVPHFGDLQIDERVASKYILSVFWGLKPGDEPMTPEGADVMGRYRPENAAHFNCLPAGPPFAMLIAPFKILQTSAEMIIVFELHDPPRQVYLDGRSLPKEPEPSWMGYSSGKWQGDTLVVDTVGFNGKAALDGFGHPRSESMHITERFHRREFGYMDVEMTLYDPKYYTRPFKLKSGFRLITDSDILEYVCRENEKDRTHVGN
jgi:hypothetical protein